MSNIVKRYHEAYHSKRQVSLFGSCYKHKTRKVASRLDITFRLQAAEPRFHRRIAPKAFQSQERDVGSSSAEDAKSSWVPHFVDISCHTRSPNNLRSISFDVMVLRLVPPYPSTNYYGPWGWSPLPLPHPGLTSSRKVALLVAWGALPSDSA